MNTVAWITSKNEQYDIKDIEARKTKLNIEDLPEGLSGFKNDMGFIDNTVGNLLNYYTKNETYNREKINELVSARLLIKIVDKLPAEEISTSTIYFLRRKKEQGTTQYESDVYDEYIYVDGTWELIGNTYVDLTDYYTKSETESKIDEKIFIETQNRTLADNTLQNNIDIVQTNVDNVNNSLNSEIVTRQNKDLSHETKMTEIESNLNSETVRATNAENNLSNRCDSYDSHVSNTENPHNVTAEQVGLGNVTNVSTTDTITLDSEKNITSGAVYNALADKVDKVDGKGLSDQNFTYEEKVKLSGLSNYDDTLITSRVSATESAIENINADSSVEGSTDYKILKALENVTSIKFEIVSELPEIGTAGIIYFVSGGSSETSNTYTEYVWLGSYFEKIGESTATVDLSDIYTKSQVNALVSVKNDKITIEENSSVLSDTDAFISSEAGENPTSMKKNPLSMLWTYIKGKISSVLGITSNKHIIQGETVDTNTYTDTNPKLVFSNEDESQNVSLTFTDYDVVQYPASVTLNGNQGGEYFIAPNIKATDKFYGNLSGKADTAGTADYAKKIVPEYTAKALTTVSTITTKYIKLADCVWNQTGTMEVYLEGNNFEDTLIINYGGGNGVFPMLCGHYTSNNNRIKSVIVQKGSFWNENYSIWIKISQESTAVVSVAVPTGSCTINISETTTAPTNVINWDINRGYWGTFTGSLNGNSTTATKATNDGNGNVITSTYATRSEVLQFDHIVDSDTALAEWANCTDGSMRNVLVKSGTYTLNNGNYIRLQDAGTTYIFGEVGNKLSFTNADFGIYNPSVDREVRITGLNVRVIGNNVCKAFCNCNNLINCTGYASYNGDSYAFFNCKKIVNCTASAGGGTEYGFYNCDYVSNCICNISGTNNSYGYFSCNNLTNCYASIESATSAYGFVQCNRISNSYATVTSTISNYSKDSSAVAYYRCNRINNSEGYATNFNHASGFNNCNYLNNCTGEATTTNNIPSFATSAYGFVQCKLVIGCSGYGRQTNKSNRGRSYCFFGCNIIVGYCASKKDYDGFQESVYSYNYCDKRSIDELPVL